MKPVPPVLVSARYPDGSLVAVVANGDRWRLVRSGHPAKGLRRDAAREAVDDLDNDLNESRAVLVEIDDAAVRALRA